MTKTLQEWKDVIEREVDFVGPYSHNIIGIALLAIAKKHGRSVANQCIEKYGLEDLGWHKEEEELV